MLKQHKQNVHLVDQYTDRSGAELVKIAGRLTDQKLARQALDTLFAMSRPLCKTASFSIKSAEDTFLSRIYFEAQREKIAANQATDIEHRLAVHEALYNLENKVQFTANNKTASESDVFQLLPQCNIASAADLVQSGKDFSANFLKLAAEDRLTFAKNFVKFAEILGVSEIPATVQLYAGMNIEANPKLADNILLRKVAMDRRGADSHAYALLHEQICNCEPEHYSLPELQKLASALSAADDACDLWDSHSSQHLPDAWHSVFQVKKAEVSTEHNDDVNTLNKADIVGRYGSGILEEIEDGKGEIDRERLKELMRLFGDKPHKFNSDTSEANTLEDAS